MTSKQRRKFPFEIKPVDPELNQQLLKDFGGGKTGFVQVGPKKFILPRKYEEVAENFYNLKLRKDDVWIVTFPRSGTTLTQELVWLVVNDLDYKTASEVPLHRRAPFLEWNVLIHGEMERELFEENADNPSAVKDLEIMCSLTWGFIEGMKGRRVIKSHLPFSLLPPDLLTSGCKVIYVARNPKDVMVSFYHLNKSIRIHGFQGDFKKHCWYFQNNLLIWSPYFEHLKEGWERRNEKNVLFMFYEDMNKNPGEAIRKVSAFLEKEMSEQEVATLQTHLKIENFRANPSINFENLLRLGLWHHNNPGFVRKGQIGSWREMFTEEMASEADKWIEENLKGTNIQFPK